MIDNEVLKITSRMRQQGDLEVRTYSVADLVVPIPDPTNQVVDPFAGTSTPLGGGQMSIPANGVGPAFGQVGQNQGGAFDPASPGRRQQIQNLDPDFTSLTELIVSTVAPDTWDQVGGPASIRTHETTLSLVIRQTQKIHEEITDLLDQLRRLQDLQVTIEVRFVTVSDRFFERIGIDFDFNIAPTTGRPQVDNNGLPLQTFGSVNLPNFGLGGTNQQGQNQNGQNQVGQQGQQAVQGAQAGGAAGLFGTGPRLNLFNNPSNPSIVGMGTPQTFTQDLSVPFQQGSFQVGVPTFGNYNPQAGMEMGLAILSDIEAFFFIQAAQGDQRNNLMFAPKVTVFNGQTGTVTDSKARPFVTSLIPTVGFASTGFQPVITTINEGITLSVTAVVSSDRRFVRLSVSPLFSSITDVFTFSFVGGGGGQQQGQQQQGQGQGGFGGGQFGKQQQQGFGIGGGFGGQQGGNNGGFGGNRGQNQNGNQNGGNQTITVQQPVVEQVTVLTTVSVPDGGTILLGGIKRLKEGRNMAGVPILNKIPYVSRLFKNTGVGRETESLMLMITPRIIIQEEEEELLGLPRT
jgi:type II secretory pathway component GspD/PulD (secretin)